MTVPPYIDPLASTEQRIIVPQGNDVELSFLVYDPNNDYAIVNITGATPTLYIKLTRFYEDTDPTTQVITGVVEDGLAGKVLVAVPASANETAGVIWYRLDISLSGEVRTSQYGPYEIFAV